MSELNLERSSSLDWDLQAVVIKAETLNRFTTTTTSNNNNNNNNNVMDNMVPPSYSWLEDYYTNHENASLLLDELHQICTPNYHNITTSNVSSSSEIGLDNTVITTTIDDQPPNQKIDTKTPVVLPKRRKNKHKKTSVHQATGDRVAFDKWNWRKYGEKVIKGSPYPRSYYRCSSSSEGCLARKQVEQSCRDPGMFQITYIDDHIHPYPRHRPSQAGRTSRRFHASQVTNSNPDNNGATSAPVIAKDLVFVRWDNKDFDDMSFADLEGFEIDLMSN